MSDFDTNERDLRCRILFASDLTAYSDRALDRSLMLASAAEASLRVLHVVDPDLLPQHIVTQSVRDAEARLERELTQSGAHDVVDVSLKVLSGDPDKVIVDQATEMQSDLIVMGLAEHATLRAIFSGTTVEQVVRAAPCPVLTVKTRPRRPYASVAVGFDASPPSQRALHLALRISPPATCTVLHASDRVTPDEGRRQEVEQAVRETVATLRPSSTSPTAVRFIAGESAAAALQREIAHLDPDLVILGTHARAGVVRFVIGSVAATLLETLPRDVLVVR